MTGGVSKLMQDIEKAILETLNTAPPLLAREIADRISLKLKRHITRTEVNQFLYGNLFRFIQDEEFRWSIKPIWHKGEKDFTAKPADNPSNVVTKTPHHKDEYVIDTNNGKSWSSYPVRIQGGSKSKCCNKPTLLTQLLPGGFVTKDCSKCGNPEFLSKTEFFHEIDLWVSCPKCRQRMAQAMIKSNYGYECKHCEMGIWLAALLPRWEDIK